MIVISTGLPDVVSIVATGRVSTVGVSSRYASVIVRMSGSHTICISLASGRTIERVGLSVTRASLSELDTRNFAP